MERDGTEFLFDAQRILNGFGYDSDFWPFGYMVAIAVIKLITMMDFFTTAKLITLLSGVGVVCLTYLLSKKVFSEHTALLSVALLTTNNLFFLHSFLVETDMLFVLFFLLTIYFLIIGDGWKNYFGAGAFSGISYMVKYGIFSVFPVVFILTLIDIAENGFIDGLKKISVFLVAFFIFSSPWLINNNLKNGSCFYSKHYLNIAWGMNRPEPMPKSYWKEYSNINNKYSSMKDVVLDSKKLLANWYRNIKGLPEIIIRVMSLIAIFLVPAYVMVFEDIDKKKLILIMISLSFLSLVTIAYTWDRYLLPVVPIFAIFSAYSILKIIPRSFNIDKIIKKFSINISFRLVVVSALLLYSVFHSTKTVFEFMNKYHFNEFKVAGEWLKYNLTPDEWIMVTEPMIAWYANTDKFVNYSNNKFLPLEDAVKVREQETFFFIQEGLSSKIITDIDYFVYDKRWWKFYYPSLISDKGPVVPDSFIPVFSTKSKKTDIIIYKIQKN